MTDSLSAAQVRGLREACRQINKVHGEARTPCGACSLADLCGQVPQANLAAKARRARAALEHLSESEDRELTADAA